MISVTQFPHQPMEAVIGSTHGYVGRIVIMRVKGLELGKCPAMTDCYFYRSVRRKWQPTLVFLPGTSNGQGSLAGYSPWVTKSQTLGEKTITSTEVVCTCSLWVLPKDGSIARC